MTWSTELVLAAHAKTQATFMNSFDLRCSLAFFAIITSAQLFILIVHTQLHFPPSPAILNLKETYFLA